MLVLSVVPIVFIAGAGYQPIVVDESSVVCTDFLGLGAEWDPRAYGMHGVTDEQFAVAAKRLEYMRLPLVRMMMLTKWCWRGDGTYDWDSEEMRLLYRHLDTCQRLGISVFLSDWGCEREWTSAPGVKDTADPVYAQAIGGYLDYLIHERGYDCIRYFILANEPNYEIGNFERWQQGVRNVAAELARRVLDQQVTLAGSDESNAPEWHRRAVDEMQDLFAVYDVHLYAGDAMVRPGGLETFFADHWNYAREHDPAAGQKRFFVGEAGLNDGALHPAINLNMDSVYYGLFMADYAVQALRAGSHAVSAWMLDDNCHQGFNWGMWSNAASGMRLRPWFYTWSLLSRYCPPGATVYAPSQPSEDVRLLAVEHPERGWTFCAVNRGDAAAYPVLQAEAAGTQRVKRYVYSDLTRPCDEKGFPVPVADEEADFAQAVRVECPARAMVLLTSME